MNVGAPVRVGIYLLGTPLVVFVAFLAGAEHFERTECANGTGFECDLAVLEGIAWSAFAAVLCLGLIASCELWLWRQRAARASADATR